MPVSEGTGRGCAVVCFPTNHLRLRQFEMHRFISWFNILKNISYWFKPFAIKDIYQLLKIYFSFKKIKFYENTN